MSTPYIALNRIEIKGSWVDSHGFPLSMLVGGLPLAHEAAHFLNFILPELSERWFREFFHLPPETRISKHAQNDYTTNPIRTPTVDGDPIHVVTSNGVTLEYHTRLRSEEQRRLLFQKLLTDKSFLPKRLADQVRHIKYDSSLPRCYFWPIDPSKTYLRITEDIAETTEKATVAQRFGYYVAGLVRKIDETPEIQAKIELLMGYGFLDERAKVLLDPTWRKHNSTNPCLEYRECTFNLRDVGRKQIPDAFIIN